ncbi:MAG: T9SS type A sorting domain-containing protein [Bacteroidota bacterium]
MKQFILLFLFLSMCSLFSQPINAQFDETDHCKRMVFEDDFSSSAGWQHQGDGSVHVSNGVCLLDHVSCGSYNRLYKDLQTTLSNTYWRAEFSYSILSPNPSNRGAGAIVLALTAGSQPFISLETGQQYTETIQDGIGVVLFSTSTTDHNINNWLFLIESKKGDHRSFDLNTGIYLDPSISDYYLRLERVSKAETQMSVFSDSTFSTHMPGSPVNFAIDPTIDGLSMIQHGTSTPGSPTRLAHAAIDNDLICDNGRVNGLFDRKEDEGPGLSVYPNPARDWLLLTYEDDSWRSSNKLYTIYSIHGARIRSKSLDESGHIDISDLIPGSYLLYVSGRKRSHWVRFYKSN